MSRCVRPPVLVSVVALMLTVLVLVLGVSECRALAADGRATASVAATPNVPVVGGSIDHAGREGDRCEHAAHESLLAATTLGREESTRGWMVPPLVAVAGLSGRPALSRRGPPTTRRAVCGGAGILIRFCICRR